jgi:hypothetical protein
MLLGCAAKSPGAGGQVLGGSGAPVTEAEKLDSLSLINLAVAAGRIDYSTGILYKVYVMYDPMSVPAEYRSDVPAKCGTPLILEVQRNWDRLTPEHRAEIAQYIEPLHEESDSDTQLDDVTPDRLNHERDSLE